jgi:hypothetical protein
MICAWFAFCLLLLVTRTLETTKQGDHKNPMSQPLETFIPFNLMYENILKWASVMASLNWQPTCINYQHNMAFTVVFASITCSSCDSYGIPIDFPEAVPLYL